MLAMKHRRWDGPCVWCHTPKLGQHYGVSVTRRWWSWGFYTRNKVCSDIAACSRGTVGWREKWMYTSRGMVSNQSNHTLLIGGKNGGPGRNGDWTRSSTHEGRSSKNLRKHM